MLWPNACRSSTCRCSMEYFAFTYYTNILESCGRHIVAGEAPAESAAHHEVVPHDQTHEHLQSQKQQAPCQILCAVTCLACDLHKVDKM